MPEIAFVGRSNAGKSSAINTLAQQRQLAFASKTPGRTQLINLFTLGPREAPDAFFADLPGYGYAAVARGKKLVWQKVMADYLEVRRALMGVVLMVDSRHGFTPLDLQLMDFIAQRVKTGEIKLLVLLTKADKLTKREARQAVEAAQRGARPTSPPTTPTSRVTLFSSMRRIGVEDVAEQLLGGRRRCPSACTSTCRRCPKARAARPSTTRTSRTTRPELRPPDHQRDAQLAARRIGDAEIHRPDAGVRAEVDAAAAAQAREAHLLALVPRVARLQRRSEEEAAREDRRLREARVPVEAAVQDAVARELVGAVARELQEAAQGVLVDRRGRREPVGHLDGPVQLEGVAAEGLDHRAFDRAALQCARAWRIRSHDRA